MMTVPVGELNMTKFTATYENGVLRPTERLPLKEGERVEVTLSPFSQSLPEDEILARIQGAKNIHEWVEATKLLPQDDGGYDVIKALDANRRWSGELPVLPDTIAGR